MYLDRQERTQGNMGRTLRALASILMLVLDSFNCFKAFFNLTLKLDTFYKPSGSYLMRLDTHPNKMC